VSAEWARLGAEQEKARERGRALAEEERKRERASLTGGALLSALEQEAQFDLRCIWTMSHDPPAVAA
jgi:hypothetical protein